MQPICYHRSLQLNRELPRSVLSLHRTATPLSDIPLICRSLVPTLFESACHEWRYTGLRALFCSTLLTASWARGAFKSRSSMISVSAQYQQMFLTVLLSMQNASQLPSPQIWSHGSYAYRLECSRCIVVWNPSRRMLRFSSLDAIYTVLTLLRPPYWRIHSIHLYLQWWNLTCHYRQWHLSVHGGDWP